MVPSTPAAFHRRSSRARAVLAVSGLVVLLAGLLAHAGFAAEKGKTITLGESLNDAQRTELLDIFDAESNDRVITITTAETVKAMEGIFPPGSINSAYSSAALTCRDLGDGLDVTTRNITVVTPDLYAIALVTAGIGDGMLVVAAPASAPAQGMTALAGVFKTWDLAPCESGNTTKSRQRLALEQLAVASEIGQALIVAGLPDGVQRAGNVVLEAQKTIVTERLTKREEIEAAILAQEQIQGVTVAPELHAKLVDVMVRLAKEEIDWSTFAAGWTIERDAGNTRITMTGDGIAIRNARATATSQAAAAMTATAEADTSSLTATAEAAANMTATAAAELMNASATAAAESANATAAANARATERASVAMTATAAAQPTATATPSPTATPGPYSASGELTELRTDEVVVAHGGIGTAFSVAPGALIARDGTPVDLGQLRVGDSVRMTVDGMSNVVTALYAEPAPVPLSQRLAKVGWLFLAGGFLSAFVVVRHRNREDPFVVTFRVR